MKLTKRAARFVVRTIGERFVSPGARRISIRRWLTSSVVAALLLASAGLNSEAQRTAKPRVAEQAIWSGASAELMKLINDEFPTVAEDEKMCFTLDADLLTRFAFHHVEGDKVAVRLGLSGASVCRGNLTQIGFLLPIPAALKEALAKAEAGSEGFLMNRKIGAGRETKFSFETKKRPSRQ